jgi:hypothetical protein
MTAHDARPDRLAVRSLKQRQAHTIRALLEPCKTGDFQSIT